MVCVLWYRQPPESTRAHTAVPSRVVFRPLGRQLARQGVAIDTFKALVAGVSAAVPSWGAERGGTRFAKFPLPGEPTTIHEKLEDCAVVNQLSRATPRVSPHLPWDKVSDYAEIGRAHV